MASTARYIYICVQKWSYRLFAEISMNKHCLNRDRVDPRGRVAPPPSDHPRIISRSFRSEIRDFTSVYYARRRVR